MQKITELLNRTAVGANLSTADRNSGAYGNAAVVVAYAYLAHELQPVLLAVIQAVGLG